MAEVSLTWCFRNVLSSVRRRSTSDSHLASDKASGGSPPMPELIPTAIDQSVFTDLSVSVSVSEIPFNSWWSALLSAGRISSFAESMSESQTDDFGHGILFSDELC